MGATGWRYFTPYQADIDAALQALRQRVFENDEYERPMLDDADPRYQAFLSTLPPEERAKHGRMIRIAKAMETLQRSIRADRPPAEDPILLKLIGVLQRFSTGDPPSDAEIEEFERMAGERGASPRKARKPKSIAALLKQCAEAGTHSILDIERIGLAGEFAAAAPMPDNIALRCYGTTQPTREQIEAAAGDATEDIDRWQAYYIVVYTDGQPSEIYFEGCSGD